MSFQLAEAFVRLGVRGQGEVDRALGHTKSKLFDFQAGLGKLGALAAGAIGVGTVTAAFKSIIATTAEAEQVQARLNAALAAAGDGAGFMSGDLEQLANELQSVSRFEDEAAKGAMAFFLTLRNVRGDVFKQALHSAADLAAFMQTDLESAAKVVGRALEDPARGMLLLRRAGVVLSESQQEQVKSLMQIGETAQAQQVILDALHDRLGGQYVEDAKTLTGQWEQLKNSFGNLQEAAGGVLFSGKGAFGGPLGLLKESSDGWTMMLNQLSGAEREGQVARDQEYFGKMNEINADLNKEHTADARKKLAQLGTIQGVSVEAVELGQENLKALRARLAKIENGRGPLETYSSEKFFGPSRKRSAAEKAEAKQDRAFRQKLRDQGADDAALGKLAALALGGDVMGLTGAMQRLAAGRGRKSASPLAAGRDDNDMSIQSRGLKNLSAESRDTLKDQVLGGLLGEGGMLGAATLMAKLGEQPAEQQRSQTLGLADIHRSIQQAALDKKDEAHKKKLEDQAAAITNWQKSGFAVKLNGKIDTTAKFG